MLNETGGHFGGVGPIRYLSSVVTDKNDLDQFGATCSMHFFKIKNQNQILTACTFAIIVYIPFINMIRLPSTI